LQETARSTKPKGGHPMIVRRSEYSNECDVISVT
jgi:hypothetical protein